MVSPQLWFPPRFPPANPSALLPATSNRHARGGLGTLANKREPITAEAVHRVAPPPCLPLGGASEATLLLTPLGRRRSLPVEAFPGPAPSLCFSVAEGAAALSLSPTPAGSLSSAMAPLPDFLGGGRFPPVLLLLLFSSPFRVQGDCTHPNVPNASLRSGDPKDSYTVGTVLSYRCIPGYEPIPGETLSLTCLDTSKWSTENPKFCRGRLCPTITLENGRIIKATDLRLGDEITLGCDEGYRIVGEKTLRCSLIGSQVVWNKELPLCQRIPCFPPPDIANGAHTGRGLDEFDHGTTVTYTCNPTFSLIGSRTITCSTAADGRNGEWRPAAPQCKVVSCPRPSIKNGMLTTTFRPTYEYNNLIMYVCEHGYTLVGSDNSKCGADSVWHPPPPQCLKGIFTTTVDPPQSGNKDTTSETGMGGGGGGGGVTLDPEIASTADNHSGFLGGSTHSPETKPPRDDTVPNRSSGVIIEKLTLLLPLLSLTIQFRLAQKWDWNPKPHDCSRAVLQ